MRIEREPGRGNRPGNSRPEDRGEGPSRPSGLSGQSGSPSGEGATRAGDNAGNGSSDPSGDNDDGNGNGNSNDDNNDLYSCSSPSM